MIQGLQSSPVFLVASAGLLGLLVGSFLNVVALRLPRMMERSWQREAREILGLEAEAGSEARFSLVYPPSRCPSCGAGIKPWQNIPVISWLALRGRCAGCGTGISVQYPLVELATGVLSAVCAWQLGWGAPLAAGLVLTWVLVALSVIDLRTQLLPDDLTLPLLWLGLGLSLVPVFADPVSAIVGAMAGYLSLWSVYWLFKLTTGKEGMGYGDFKLLAALGAWLGWQALPMILLLSSLVGAMVGIALIVARRAGRSEPLPFGPYLAAAGWVALLFGDALTRAYLGQFGG